MYPAIVASARSQAGQAPDSTEIVTCMCRAPSRPGRYDLSIEIDTTPLSEFGTEGLGRMQLKGAFIKRTLHFKNVEVIQAEKTSPK